MMRCADCQHYQQGITYRQDLGQQCGCEEGGMLDDNIVTLVLVWYIQLIQQVMGWLAHLQQHIS